MNAKAPLVIGYFSLEFGLAECLPIYSGGLGVLAGDHLKATSDLGLPLVAVGLLYRQGFGRQEIDADGRQVEVYTEHRGIDLPVRQGRGRRGRSPYRRSEGQDRGLAGAGRQGAAVPAGHRR